MSYMVTPTTPAKVILMQTTAVEWWVPWFPEVHQKPPQLIPLCDRLSCLILNKAKLVMSVITSGDEKQWKGKLFLEGQNSFLHFSNEMCI